MLSHNTLSPPDPHCTVYSADCTPLTVHFQTEEGASVFRLTVLPEEQEQVTDYSCRAENSLGSSRATVLLSGLPAPPVISSGELSARQTRYTQMFT